MSENLSKEDKSFGIWWIVCAILLLSLLYFPPSFSSSEGTPEQRVPSYDERMKEMG